MPAQEHTPNDHPGLSQLELFRGPDRWICRQHVPSTTDPDIVYVVARTPSGLWGCSCPAWVYDPDRRPCKHIRALRGDHHGGEPSTA